MFSNFNFILSFIIKPEPSYPGIYMSIKTIPQDETSFNWIYYIHFFILQTCDISTLILFDLLILFIIYISDIPLVNQGFYIFSNIGNVIFLRIKM